MTVPTFSIMRGRPDLLSWTWTLVDSDVGDDVVSADDAVSWGSFSLTVRGQNLCETVQQGERLVAAHWYLLPVAEWLVENWSPLFHEQRLPLPRQVAAAQAQEQAQHLLDGDRPLESAAWGYSARSDEELLEQHQQWRWRHCLASAAPQAPLPDVWLRRVNGDLEISLSAGPRPLFDLYVDGTATLEVARVPVAVAAAETERAVRALLDELDRRSPRGRAAAALARLDAVTSSACADVNLAWLVGLPGDAERLQAIREEIDALSELDSEPRQDLVLLAPPRRHSVRQPTSRGGHRRPHPARQRAEGR